MVISVLCEELLGSGIGGLILLSAALPLPLALLFYFLFFLFVLSGAFVCFLVCFFAVQSGGRASGCSWQRLAGYASSSVSRPGACMAAGTFQGCGVCRGWFPWCSLALGMSYVNEPLCVELSALIHDL